MLLVTSPELFLAETVYWVRKQVEQWQQPLSGDTKSVLLFSLTICKIKATTHNINPCLAFSIEYCKYKCCYTSVYRLQFSKPTYKFQKIVKTKEINKEIPQTCNNIDW